MCTGKNTCKLKETVDTKLNSQLGAKINIIAGGVHNAKLPTNRTRSSTICRRTGLVQAQFADEQDSFKHNLPTKMTFLEFDQ